MQKRIKVLLAGIIACLLFICFIVNPSATNIFDNTKSKEIAEDIANISSYVMSEDIYKVIDDAVVKIEENNLLEKYNFMNTNLNDNLKNSVITKLINDINEEQYEIDVYWLSVIIHCEAGGEPYDGKIAVGNVVLNRVESDKYPNTIQEVILDEGQFAPVGSGWFRMVFNSGKVYEDCIKAAIDVLNGEETVPDDYLYFHRAADNETRTVIGKHVFY